MVCKLYVKININMAEEINTFDIRINNIIKLIPEDFEDVMPIPSWAKMLIASFRGLCGEINVKSKVVDIIENKINLKNKVKLKHTDRMH